MAIAFGFNNNADFSGVTSFNFVKGSNTINSGDVIIISAFLQPSSGDPGTVNPTGFTSIVDTFDSGSTGARYYIGYKVAGGAESGSYSTQTLATTCFGSWDMCTFTGGSASPIDVTSGSIINSATLTCPSLSPVGATDTYVGVIVATSGGGTFVPPVGLTNRVDTINNSASNQEIIVSDKLLSSSGATGTFNGTQTSSFAYAGAGLTLIPAAGGGDVLVSQIWM